MIDLPDPCPIEAMTDVLDVLRYQNKLSPIEDWVDWVDNGQESAIKKLLS